MTRGPPKRGAPSTFCLNISKEFEGHTNWDILTSSHKTTHVCKGKSFCFFRTRWGGSVFFVQNTTFLPDGPLEALQLVEEIRIHHQGEWKWFLPFLLHKLSKSTSTLVNFGWFQPSGFRSEEQEQVAWWKLQWVSGCWLVLIHTRCNVGLWRLVLDLHSFIIYTYTIHYAHWLMYLKMSVRW